MSTGVAPDERMMRMRGVSLVEYLEMLWRLKVRVRMSCFDREPGLGAEILIRHLLLELGV